MNQQGQGQQGTQQQVVVRDVDMQFSSMVIFMVKWAIASIPAMFILGAIVFVLAAMFAAMFGIGAAAAG